MNLPAWSKVDVDVFRAVQPQAPAVAGGNIPSVEAEANDERYSRQPAMVA